MTNQVIFEGLKQSGTPSYERTVSYVWETFGGKIIGMVMNRGGSEADGYDVLSEAILKLLAQIEKAKYTQKDNFGGLLYTIAFNTCMDMFTKRKNPNSPEQNWAELTDKQMKDMEDDSDKIISCLFHEGRGYDVNWVSEAWALWKDTPCKNRYYLLIVEGKSRQDLAKEEKVTEGNMDTILSRCRKKFRALVAKLGKQKGYK